MKLYQEILYSLFVVPFTAGNGMRTNEGLRIHDGSISTLAIAVYLIGIAFVTIFVSSTPLHVDPDNFIRFVLITVVLIGVGALVFLWVKFRRQMRENEIMVNYTTNTKPTGLRLKFLWLFCLGLIVRAALSMARRFHNISTSYHLARSYVSIIWNILLFVFACLQTAFISYFRNTEIVGSLLVHYGMIFIVVANLSVWFDSILAQERHFFHLNFNETKINNFGVESFNCTNESSIVCFAENAFPYVLPIVAEFCLVSIGFLFQIWSSAKRTMIKNFLMTSSDIQGESTSLLNSEYVEIDQQSSYNYGARRKSALLYLSAAVGAVFVVVLLIIVLAILTEKKEEELRSLYISLEIYRLMYTIIMIGLVFLGFGLLYGQCVPTSNPRHISGSEYILLFSSLGMVMYLVFGVVAGFNFKSQGSWNIAENILSLILVYFQTVLMLQSYRYRRYRKLECLSIKNVFMLLAVMNLGLWFNDSFLQNRVPYINEVNYKMYKQEIWDFVNGTLFPITVFFRFQCSMILYELHHLFRTHN
ncbi:uncharacterized protein LOC133175373 [Saccostrea echinata]|uniref:uncharacterized protein LOC133175373 n=1 Tax=Saccostrea echinata TaxID=191078 RepID=UPI002A7F6164|nr:uncharacterized protein LOC133175373 [Saccostrea echinata]